MYANRVEGEFHASDEDFVIPLAWVEAAVERWHEWDAAGHRTGWTEGSQVIREGLAQGVGHRVRRARRNVSSEVPELPYPPGTFLRPSACP
ncbi:hypothetical protein ACFY8S_34190 [Streptomyces hygroscopicus]|uniref:hypothetical protein n=1 Tax=Streptomyces hygroscopicus TaxID=1912 RepID=UPI0036C5AB85